MYLRSLSRAVIGDRGQRLVLALHLDVFLGLDRLVQALRQAPSLHHAASELVDEHHLAVLDDVVAVLEVERVGAQRLVDVMHEGDIVQVVERSLLEEVGLAQQGLHLLDAGLGQGHGAMLLVHLIVVAPELRQQPIDAAIGFGGVFRAAGDDERRARLVDQDRIDLVDDAVEELALAHVLQAELHVVAQIVEAHLAVGAVGHVGAIGGLALGIVDAVHDDADGEPQELVDLAHPFRVAAGQVVVDGDDMHALAGECVQIDRERRHQGLAFAGLHLGDAAPMQHHAAQELHVEMPLAQGAFGRLAHGGEGIDQEVVQPLAGGMAALQPVGALPELLIAELSQARLQRVDRHHVLAQALDDAVVDIAEQTSGQGAEHGIPQGGYGSQERRPPANPSWGAFDPRQND